MPPHTDPKPTWLSEPCPVWCTRAHHETDHPEDRYHQDAGVVFPAVVGDMDDVDLRPQPHERDLVLRRTRSLGDTVTWVRLEALESLSPSLILTLESARELLTGLAALL